jgi:hypothetical protein
MKTWINNKLTFDPPPEQFRPADTINTTQIIALQLPINIQSTQTTYWYTMHRVSDEKCPATDVHKTLKERAYKFYAITDNNNNSILPITRYHKHRKVTGHGYAYSTIINKCTCATEQNENYLTASTNMCLHDFNTYIQNDNNDIIVMCANDPVCVCVNREQSIIFYKKILQIPNINPNNVFIGFHGLSMAAIGQKVAINRVLVTVQELLTALTNCVLPVANELSVAGIIYAMYVGYDDRTDQHGKTTGRSTLAAEH